MGNSGNKMDISVRQEVYEPYRDHCKAAKTSMRAQMDLIVNEYLDSISWPGEANFKPSPKLKENGAGADFFVPQRKPEDYPNPKVILPVESPEEFSKRFAHLRVGVNSTVLKAKPSDPSRLRVQDSSTFQKAVKEFASKNDEVPDEIKALSGVPDQVEKAPFFVANPPRLPTVDRSAPAPGGLFSEEAIAELAYEVKVTPRNRVSPAIGRSIPLDEIPSCIDPTFGSGRK